MSKSKKKTVTVLFSGLLPGEGLHGNGEHLLAYSYVKEKHFDEDGKMADKKLIALIEDLFGRFEGGKFTGYEYLQIVHLSSRVKPRTEAWGFGDYGRLLRKLCIKEAGTARDLFLAYDDNAMSQACEI